MNTIRSTVLGALVAAVAVASIPITSHALVIDDGVIIGSGAGEVIAPDQPVSGTSQLALSQQWWQWALGVPTELNPLTDSTGASATINNDGPVFFIAGGLSGSVVRSFTVPAGVPVFFPVINNIDIEFDVTPPAANCFAPGESNPVACALGFISPGLTAATQLRATLDGQNLLTFPSHRQTSTAFFDLNLPANNLFSVAAGTYVGRAVSDGYWVALSGLSPGLHTLGFGGTPGGGAPLNVTLSLTAAVPETSTFLLMLAGLVFIVGTGRLQRRKSAGPFWYVPPPVNSPPAHCEWRKPSTRNCSAVPASPAPGRGRR